MTRLTVLFVCIHNSARSQMAEAWLNTLYGDRFAASSAGLEPGTLNPLAVQLMAEAGVDIAGNQTKNVFDLLSSGRRFDYVITVCDETAAERCPLFPGSHARLHWGFPDPAQVQGSVKAKLAQVRAIRDAIRAQVDAWAATFPA